MNCAYALLATLAIAAVGCGPIVTVGGPGSTTTSHDPGDTATGTTSSSSSSSSSSGTSGSGGAAPAPSTGDDIAQVENDVLHVALASYSQTCGADNFPACGASATWQVTLGIPVAKLVVGAELQLKDVNAMTTGTSPGDPSNPNSCGGGGGTYWDGTVKVLAVSDAKVTLRLGGTMPVIVSSANADGDYEVSLCGPAAPLPGLLTNALATPSPYTPGNLVLDVMNVPLSCLSPTPPAGADYASARIDLPPSMQNVGTYPLSAIATSYETLCDSQMSCSGGGGTYADGTIQITSIDASHVAFTLLGTSGFFLFKGNADGSFVAPRCNGGL